MRKGTDPVQFHRTKYGRRWLIDIARVRELNGFILGEPHVLRFFDIILVTEGRGTFWLDGHRHRVQPGAVFFTTPGQVRWWDVTQFDGVCLFFEEGFVSEFLQDETFLRRQPYFYGDAARAGLALAPAAARRMRAKLGTMQRELRRGRHDSLDLLRAQLHELLITMARRYASEHAVEPQRPAHPVVSKFIDMVTRDAGRRRIAAYAAELAISPGHLSVLCAQYTGWRAKRLLDRARASHARRLLLCSDESAARIGAELGFDDPSYFSRFFRRETGQTPTACRRALRGLPRSLK